MIEQFIGIDPSITGTSVSVISPDLKIIRTEFFTEIKRFQKMDYQFFLPHIVPKDWRSLGNEHFFDQLTTAIINQILKYAKSHRCKIVLEDYAFAAKGLIFSIGEFVGLLKYKLRVLHSIEFEKVPPASIKKFIFKGNFSKADLLYTFMNRHIHSIENINNEQATELRKLISDESLKFNLVKVDSPLGDIMDSVYMALYARGCIQ